MKYIQNKLHIFIIGVSEEETQNSKISLQEYYTKIINTIKPNPKAY